VRRFFRATPPSVHQMVLSLERAGLISRQPGLPRSIVVLLERSALPERSPRDAQPVKTTVTSLVAACQALFYSIRFNTMQTGWIEIAPPT
jgi:hypothetical protein